MCMSCGCGEPYDDHGNPDNIVFEDVKKAADAEGISVEKAVENIRAALANVKE